MQAASGVVANRSTRSLYVMKQSPRDSLDAIEAMMALEEELEGPLPKRVPEIKPYLVAPFEAPCIKGGFAVDALVFARHRSTVLLRSWKRNDLA